MVVSDVDTGHDQSWRFFEQSMDTDLHGVRRISRAGPHGLAVEVHLVRADRTEPRDRLSDPASLPVGHNHAYRSEPLKGSGERSERGTVDAVVVGQQDPAHARVSALPGSMGCRELPVLRGTSLACHS